MARRIRSIRHRQGLSQSDLAELAGVSTKTIQRLEAARAIAGRSRRAVLSALKIASENLDGPESDKKVAAEGCWVAVKAARTLMKILATARSFEIELDLEGWRRELRDRPWYRRDLVLASHNPTDVILEIVDRAPEMSRLSPGKAARQQRELSEAMTAAEAMGWSFATRLDDQRHLSLYLGCPSTVSERAKGSS
ncbi:MAG: helix-turn-helix domain-containing protein [Deltaproteobacteria bacterium]|nr:helix-turn-helix domain-containing protein [Deltaproteobacteria bacterium]